MSGVVKRGSGSTSDELGQLAVRLDARRDEIHETVATRVYALAGVECDDLDYLEGLQRALRAAVAFCLEVLRAPGGAAPLPDELLAQARAAARHQVGLDGVLRRYVAGYGLIVDFAVEEAARAQLLRGARLQQLLRMTNSMLDDVIAAVSDEYGRELCRQARTGEQRRDAMLRRLLDGEAVDSSSLLYDFKGSHLGAAFIGEEARAAFLRLGAQLDRRTLLLRLDGETYAGWLGGRRPLDKRDVTGEVKRMWPPAATLALGIPAQGLSGWRLTHREARASLAVARRTGQALVWYCEVPLVAAALRDEFLAASLRHLYLDRLGDGRHGHVLRETLRAYFAAQGNLSATAVALGISRRTVAVRIQQAEALLGGPLASIAAGLQTALDYERAS